MSKFIRIAAALVVLGGALGTGYLAYRHWTAPRHFAGVLPPDTVCYLRLRGVGTLHERAVADGALRDPAKVREALDAWYSGLFDQAAAQRQGLSPATLRGLIDSAESVHLAIVPQEVPSNEASSHGRPPIEPVFFFELAEEAPLRNLVGELGDLVIEKDLDGVQVWDLSNISKEPLVAHLADGVLVLGGDAAVSAILRATKSGLSESLADSEEFGRTLDDFGREGDLFGFISLAGVRKLVASQVDPSDPTARSLEALREFGAIGLSAAVEGELAVRIYAAPGEKIPEFIVRKPSHRELIERAPANSLLVFSAGYEGGKETRRSFADWILEKTAGGVRLEDLPIDAPVAEVMTEDLEKLEKEVVVISKDFLVAALPVDRELMVCAAPDAAGAMGIAAAFDYEDRAQVETLYRKLFEEGGRAELPWHALEYEGLSIRYLDIAEWAKKEGADLPEDLSSLQLTLGYAIGENYAYAGSVALIQELHKPTGETLGRSLEVDGIDGANSFLFALRAGAFLDGPLSKLEPVAKIQSILKSQIPEDAAWCVSATSDEEAITFRTNIPFTSLAAWLALDPSVAEAFREGMPSPTPRRVDSPHEQDVPPTDAWTRPPRWDAPLAESQSVRGALSLRFEPVALGPRDGRLEVRVPWPGRIEQWNVEVGQYVQGDQELGRMDTTLIGIRRRIAEIDLEDARATLDLAESGNATEDEAERARRSADEARESMDRIDQQMAQAILRAPAAGMVHELPAAEGFSVGLIETESRDILERAVEWNQAKLDGATTTYDRCCSLQEAGAVSAREMRMAERALREAELELEYARRRLAIADGRRVKGDVAAVIQSTGGLQSPRGATAYQVLQPGGSAIGLAGRDVWICLAGEEEQAPRLGTLEETGTEDRFTLRLRDETGWPARPELVVAVPRGDGSTVRNLRFEGIPTDPRSAGAALVASVGTDLEVRMAVASGDGSVLITLPEGPCILRVTTSRGETYLGIARGLWGSRVSFDPVSLDPIDARILLPESAVEEGPRGRRTWRVWGGKAHPAHISPSCPAAPGLLAVQADLYPGERILVAPPGGLADGDRVHEPDSDPSEEIRIQDLWEGDRIRLQALPPGSRASIETARRIMGSVGRYATPRILRESSTLLDALEPH